MRQKGCEAAPPCAIVDNLRLLPLNSAFLYRVSALLIRSAARNVLLLGCLWAFAGCAGDGPPPPDTSSSFDAIQQTIFDPNCLSSGCHNSISQAGGLVLEAGVSYTNLVNVASMNMAAHDQGLLRVTPFDPQNSFLFIKITNPDTAAGEGNRMPLTGSLSPAQIEQVQAWIAAGAPGSNLPSPISSPTSTPTVTATATLTNVPTATPSTTPTGSATATPTLTVTASISPTGTLPATATPTLTPSPTRTPSTTPTATPTPTPSTTATPSLVPTPTFSLASTFAEIQANIFTPTCLTVGCHDAVGAAFSGNLNLEPAQSYAALVSVTPTNAAAQTAGLLRVDPGRPDNSFLLAKLTLPVLFDPQFGSRMPLAQPPLAPGQIEDIQAWILRGALPTDAP